MESLFDELFADMDTDGDSPPRRPTGTAELPDAATAPRPYATGRLSQAQIMPQPPVPVPPAALYNRLLEDLGFGDGPALCTILDSWNEDLFSGLPANPDLYRECQFLSTLPSDVVAWGDGHTPDRGPIDIRAHGSAPFPSLPARREDLPAYCEALTRFFRAELRAREESYRRVLANFCSALYRYLRASTRQLHRQAALKGRPRDLQEMLRAAVAERYYRETARLARVLFLHLYLFLVREILWAVYAEQVMRQDLFEGLCCDLEQARQLSCLFQPLLFVHGTVSVRGAAVAPARLREINYVRERLNLPLIRSAATEEPGAALTAAPALQTQRARSSGYFMTLIRVKLDAYSEGSGSEGAEVLREHAYSRRRERTNYGSSIEGLLELPDDTDYDPDAPPPPPRLSFAAAPPRRRSAAPRTDVSLGDELRFDGDVSMTPSEALDDFDLTLLGDDDHAGGLDDAAAYASLDMADFEFEQMFTDALGIDDIGG
ncbi:transactivating tegument protein VP16 [Macacine alphaherpesvirus 1]|nr:transactivating tegument protein VP16 [Macacine alphaherpesvirus 1]ARS02060.1 transactivating tegument protein VP16 [Macacine alphaherpesvirus 1]ARS02135.1 transactivating tegument protein VP16 [Macacine alphaherpesvirus 1]ARS02210.1 transactivating tegument protein VP16 [Macacine alphaherpesvirus 1]ARS02285.1 transactivating tegument protein VP16 [Macacine alphaherpesvirus 1]